MLVRRPSVGSTRALTLSLWYAVSLCFRRAVTTAASSLLQTVQSALSGLFFSGLSQLLNDGSLPCFTILLLVLLLLKLRGVKFMASYHLLFSRIHFYYVRTSCIVPTSLRTWPSESLGQEFTCICTV